MESDNPITALQQRLLMFDEKCQEQSRMLNEKQQEINKLNQLLRENNQDIECFLKDKQDLKTTIEMLEKYIEKVCKNKLEQFITENEFLKAKLEKCEKDKTSLTKTIDNLKSVPHQEHSEILKQKYEEEVKNAYSYILQLENDIAVLQQETEETNKYLCEEKETRKQIESDHNEAKMQLKNEKFAHQKCKIQLQQALSQYKVREEFEQKFREAEHLKATALKQLQHSLAVQQKQQEKIDDLESQVHDAHIAQLRHEDEMHKADMLIKHKERVLGESIKKIIELNEERYELREKMKMFEEIHILSDNKESEIPQEDQEVDDATKRQPQTYTKEAEDGKALVQKENERLNEQNKTLSKELEDLKSKYKICKEQFDNTQLEKTPALTDAEKDCLLKCLNENDCIQKCLNKNENLTEKIMKLFECLGETKESESLDDKREQLDRLKEENEKLKIELEHLKQHMEQCNTEEKDETIALLHTKLKSMPSRQELDDAIQKTKELEHIISTKQTLIVDCKTEKEHLLREIENLKGNKGIAEAQAENLEKQLSSRDQDEKDKLINEMRNEILRLLAKHVKTKVEIAYRMVNIIGDIETKYRIREKMNRNEIHRERQAKEEINIELQKCKQILQHHRDIFPDQKDACTNTDEIEDPRSTECIVKTREIERLKAKIILLRRKNEELNKIRKEDVQASANLDEFKELFTNLLNETDVPQAQTYVTIAQEQLMVIEKYRTEKEGLSAQLQSTKTELEKCREENEKLHNDIENEKIIQDQLNKKCEYKEKISMELQKCKQAVEQLNQKLEASKLKEIQLADPKVDACTNTDEVAEEDISECSDKTKEIEELKAQIVYQQNKIDKIKEAATALYQLCAKEDKEMAETETL